MPVLPKKVPVVPAKGASKTPSHDSSHPQQVSPAKLAAPSAQGQKSEAHVAAAAVPTATHGSTLFKPQITATNIAHPTSQRTTRPLGPQLSLSASLPIFSRPPSATRSATISHEFARPSLSGSIIKHQSQTRPTLSSSARFPDNSGATNRKSHISTHSETLFKSSILPGSTKLHPRPSSAANLHTSDAGVFPSPTAHKIPPTFSMSVAHTVHSTGSSQSDGHHRPSRLGSGPKVQQFTAAKYLLLLEPVIKHSVQRGQKPRVPRICQWPTQQTVPQDPQIRITNLVDYRPLILGLIHHLRQSPHLNSQSLHRDLQLRMRNLLPNRRLPMSHRPRRLRRNLVLSKQGLQRELQV